MQSARAEKDYEDIRVALQDRWPRETEDLAGKETAQGAEEPSMELVPELSV